MRLHALHAQFVLTATSIGQTIIREAFVLDRDKSIPRGPFAGLAGGSKYAAAGIFFKYAHDLYGIYGGNEAAAKAAGHEARSHAALSALAGSPLRQPLCIVLDYLGYRLICMALLPISQRSLQYGSADGGRHVLCQHDGIARAAADVARALFLKAHRAGLPSRTTDTDSAPLPPLPPTPMRVFDNRVDLRAPDKDGYLSDSLHSLLLTDDDGDDDFDDDEDELDEDDGGGYDSLEDSVDLPAVPRNDGTAELHFPGDIECHLGSDGRFYVIDVARLFPPEAPTLFLFGILLEPESNTMTEVELSVRERRRSIVAADVHQRLVALLGTSYRTLQVADDLVLHYSGVGKVNQLATAFVGHLLLEAQQGAVEISGLALAVRSERSAHLINLLRPELLQAHQTPLSSDAYSMWGFDQHEVHNGEVLAATRELATSVAPRLVASWLADAARDTPSGSLLERSVTDAPPPADPQTLGTHLPIDGADLVRELHRCGINVRYLGLVRSQLGNRADERASRLRGLVLIEMISRVCKNYLRTRLREVRSALIDEYHNVIVRVFNLVLGVCREADQFWAVHIRCLLLLKFGRYSSPLHEGERSPAHDLRSQLSKASLFLRLQEATGVLFRVGGDAFDLGFLERYFASQSSDPLRPAQIVRLAGKTKKLVFAQGGIGVGVGVGVGGTRNPARSLPNHAATSGFASRFDEQRARLVCASLPTLPAALFDWRAVSAGPEASAEAALATDSADDGSDDSDDSSDDDGAIAPSGELPSLRFVKRQTALFSQRSRSLSRTSASLQPTPLVLAAAPPAAAAPTLEVADRHESTIFATVPQMPLPHCVEEQLRIDRALLPLSWRAEQGAGAGVVCTLAHAAAVLVVAHRWAELLFDIVQRGVAAARKRPNNAAFRVVARLADDVRRRALLWLCRGAATFSGAFERQAVAADSAIACVVVVSKVCERIQCADAWLGAQLARMSVKSSLPRDRKVPELTALVASLLDEDGSFVAGRACDGMPLRSVDDWKDDAHKIDCVTAVFVSLRQAIAWLEELYGGRGRAFGGGHPLLIVLWRRLAAALRVSVDGAEHEARRVRLIEANDLMGFAAHLTRTFSPDVNERELVARLLTHPNLSITLAQAPVRLMSLLGRLTRSAHTLSSGDSPHSVSSAGSSPRSSMSGSQERVLLRDDDATTAATAAAAAPADEAAPPAELPLVHTFGHNKDGRLGLGDDADQRAPCVVGSLQGMDVVQVECGDRFTVALCRSGAVYAWGDCSLGHVLGLDANVYRAPMRCRRLENHRIVRVLSINTYNHRATIAVDDTGAAAVFGQLGSLPSDVDELLADGPLLNVAAGGWRLFVDGRVQCGRSKRADVGGGGDDVEASDSSAPAAATSAMPHGLTAVAIGAVSASHAVVLATQAGGGGTQVLTQQHGQLQSIIRDEPCVAVACGRQFVTVLAQSGSVFEWTPSLAAPISFASTLSKVRIVRIAAGDWHAAALSSAGDLFTWGSDKYGQCGHGSSNDGDSSVPAPRRVSALRARWVIDVSCGSNHTAVVSIARRRIDIQLVSRMRPLEPQPMTRALRLDRAVLAKRTSFDVLMTPTTARTSATAATAAAPAAAAVVTATTTPSRPVSFAAESAALSVAASASLQCWMWRVPFRTTHTVSSTQAAATTPGAAGSAMTAVDEMRLCRITRRTVVRTQNPFHERAAKVAPPSSGVRPLPGLQRCEFTAPQRASTTGAAQPTMVGVGGVRGWGRMDDSIAIVCHGAVLTAGRNADGQLGHGDYLTRASKAEPLLSLQCETVVSVGQSSHAAFVTDSGRLFTCGRNGDGQCGHGDLLTRLVPRSVVALHQISIASVACGASHTLASDRSGEVWSWGGNSWGQLGHGDRSKRTQPIHVRYMHQVVAVAAGHSHSAALTRGAALFSWGYGRYGALGLGSLRDEFVPRRVHLIDASSDAAALPPVIDVRRSAYGNRAQRNAASRGANVKLLACGPSHTVAVDTADRIWYWGGHIDVAAALPRLAHCAPSATTTESAPLALHSLHGGFQCAAVLARDGSAFALLFGAGDLLSVEMVVMRADSRTLCAVEAAAVNGRLHVPRLDQTVARQYVVAFATGSSQFVCLL